MTRNRKPRFRKPAVLFSEVPKNAGRHEDDSAESTARAIQQALFPLECETVRIPCPCPRRSLFELFEGIFRSGVDFVFNFCEEMDGDSRFEGSVAALLELSKIPFSGCRAEALFLCRDKFRVNAILKRHGIPVPKSYYAEKESDLVLPEGPVIVKPCREDGSYGVSRGNVGAGRKELAAAFRDIQKIVPGPVVVEEYIEGREINAALLGGKSLPLSEIVFEYEDASHPRILTYEAKWDERSESYRRSSPRCPACLGAPLEQEIRETAERIFRILELRHYARVDFRVGPKGVFSVIDVNPNPSIAPDSGFLNAMRAMNPPRSALRGETGSRADGTVIAYKKIIDVFTMI